MTEDMDLFVKGCNPSAETSDREAQILHDLRGPGIVALQGRGADDELLLAKAACSLADVLHERGPIPADEVRAVGAATAAALARVHEAGLVHGDVKPANLLLSRSGELLLADFDAASPVDGRRLRRVSPPRLVPGAPARPATDIRALAITLVELSTGSLIDPGVPWRAQDLRRLGCPPDLSAEISFMLGREGAAPSARSVARMLERGCGMLPAPAEQARHVDPTPTVEFMPARRSAPLSSTRPERTRPDRPPKWWLRLAASWRRAQGPAPVSDGSRTRPQASGGSQARRSS